MHSQLPLPAGSGCPQSAFCLRRAAYSKHFTPKFYLLLQEPAGAFIPGGVRGAESGIWGNRRLFEEATASKLPV